MIIPEIPQGRLEQLAEQKVKYDSAKGIKPNYRRDGFRDGYNSAKELTYSELLIVKGILNNPPTATNYELVIYIQQQLRKSIIRSEFKPGHDTEKYCEGVLDALGAYISKAEQQIKIYEDQLQP
jgi:hypothetical protein